MNNLQVFKNEQFGEVRTIEENGKILFCGSDCAKALGYSRANDAVSAHCRYTAKRRIATKQGNMSEMSFIPEGDLYRLFQWMRDNDYLMKRKGNGWNMPTQKSMELGLFEIKERIINNPDGTVDIKKTTKVTGKGQQYFINKFLRTA